MIQFLSTVLFYTIHSSKAISLTGIKDDIKEKYKDQNDNLGFIQEINKLIDDFNEFAIDSIKLRVIADYISGMTDRMAEMKYNEICSSGTQWSKAYSERGGFNL